MYARVSKADFNPGKKEKGTKTYEEVVNAGRQQEGFLGALLLTSPDGEKSISVTLWKSKDDMLRTEESGWWQSQVDRFKDVFSSAPVREHYDVAYQSFPKEEAAAAEKPGEEARPSQ